MKNPEIATGVVHEVPKDLEKALVSHPDVLKKYEFDAATEKVNTDGETSVTFVADKKGTFEFYCSVGSHRTNGMVGTLIVE
ncbi:MAG TPA: plastocyanin/azurin family copper-binding protein [Candidatus Gracilibacteria bacterium]